MRNFQTTVELREGETLAVAGLTRSSTSNSLPQGVYPANTNTTTANQELVVLISPMLLHHMGSESAENGNPLSAQNIELYLRSRNTQVSRGDALFLIGPQGYASEANQGSAVKR
jgi:hypothetical protein